MNLSGRFIGGCIAVLLIGNAVGIEPWERWTAGDAVGRDDSAWSSEAPGTQSEFLRRLYIGPDGTAYRYVVFVPARTPENSGWPVILYLNGHGKNGSDVDRTSVV